jgi:hypothetical protein
MTVAAKAKREVTLPEGVSLRRVAEVLLDAWEADPRRPSSELMGDLPRRIKRLI